MPGNRNARAATLAAFVLTAGNGPSVPQPSAGVVVAAEREFAAHAAEHGWIPAFRAYAAPEGVVIADGQIRNARTYFNALADAGSHALNWWPAMALIARSGDLGFTTGPYTVDASGIVRGQYFTVWQRQPDGRWLWVFDGGTGTAEPATIPREGQVAEFPRSTSRHTSRRAARARVAEIEAAHHDARSLAPLLAPHARVLRPGRAPASGAAARQDMTFPKATLAYGPIERNIASRAGDLVFTIGRASWTEGPEGARAGHYARIWQYRPEGWRIVFDELLPAPPPKSAS